MNKKTIALLIASVFLAATLGGCFPTEKRSANTEKGDLSSSDIIESRTTPSRVEREINENVIISADVILPDVESIPATPASLRSLASEKVIATLLRDESVADTNNHTENNQTFTFIQGEKGSFISISPGSILFTRENYYDGKDFQGVLFNSKSYIDTDGLKKLFTKGSLDSIELQSAQESVDSVLAALGFSNLTDPEVIALDVTALKEQFNISQESAPENKSAIQEFDVNDEGYLFIYGVNLDGVNLTQSGYLEESGFGACIGTRIYALVTANGLIMLRGDGIYDFGTPQTAIDEHSSLEDVLAQIGFKYQDVALTEPVVIDSIRLEYIPVWNGGESMDFTLSPYWVCSASHTQSMSDEKGTFENTEKFPIYISYKDGKELSIGGVI